jgi:RNA polymerase sigma-70 factor, ECF subfamily
MQNLGKKTDEEIVILVRRDKEIYVEIVERYQAKLLRYVQYLIGDHHKARDVVQETFIRAYVNLNSFNVKQKFSSWIYRIAHNLAINEIKKYQRELPLIDVFESDEHEKIQDDLEKKEVILELKRCLEKMPLIYKEPITLFYLEEKSYEDISDILRIPGGTVAIRISRAKKMLKKLCQKKLNNQT